MNLGNYNVGMRFDAKNNVSGVARIMGRDLKMFELSAKNATRALAGLKTAAVGGALLAGAAAIATAAANLSKAATDLNRARTNMLTSGAPAGDVEGFYDRSRSQRVRGTTSTDRMRARSELYQVYNDKAKVEQVVGTYLNVMQAIRPYDPNGDQMRDLIIASDLSNNSLDRQGRESPALQRRDLAMRRAQLMATEGQVNGNVQRLMMADSKGMGQFLSMEGEIGLTGFMQTNRDRSGDMLYTANQALVNGRRTKKATENLRRLGLVDESGQLYDRELFQANPLAWMNTTGNSRMAAKGIVGSEAQTKAIMRSGLAANAGAFLGDISANRRQYNRDAGRVNRAMGVDPLQIQRDTDVQTNLNDLTAAWTDFKIELASSAAPVIIPALQALTSIMEKLSAFAVNHPKIAGAILPTMAILSVVFGVLGIILIGIGVVLVGAALGITAAMVGIGLAIAAAVAAVIVVVVLLVAYWDDLVKWIGNAGKWIGHAVMQFIRGAGKWLADVNRMWMNFKIRVGLAIISFIVGVGQFIARLAGRFVTWHLQMAAKITSWIGNLWNSFTAGFTRFFDGIKTWIDNHIPKFTPPNQVVDGVAQGPRGEPGEGAARAGAALVRPRSAGGNQNSGTVVVPVSIDGREVARVVAANLSTQNERPAAGPSGFNPSQGFMNPGSSFA